MYAFWDAIDVSENIGRGLRAIRGVTGLSALCLLAALGMIEYALFWLILFFDVGATLEWTELAATTIAPSIPAPYLPYAGMLVLSITFLPTLAELFGSRFARAGIHVAAGLVFACSLFDAVTDFPRVATFLEAFRPAFERLGVFATPIFWLVRGLWLFMASFGFEALFIVFFVCMLALALNVSSRSVRSEVL